MRHRRDRGWHGLRRLSRVKARHWRARGGVRRAPSSSREAERRACGLRFFRFGARRRRRGRASVARTAGTPTAAGSAAGAASASRSASVPLAANRPAFSACSKPSARAIGSLAPSALVIGACCQLACAPALDIASLRQLGPSARAIVSCYRLEPPARAIALIAAIVGSAGGVGVSDDGARPLSLANAVVSTKHGIDPLFCGHGAKLACEFRDAYCRPGKTSIRLRKRGRKSGEMRRVRAIAAKNLLVRWFSCV